MPCFHLFSLVVLSTLAFALAFAQIVPPVIPTSREYYLQTKVLSGDTSKDDLYGEFAFLDIPVYCYPRDINTPYRVARNFWGAI